MWTKLISPDLTQVKIKMHKTVRKSTKNAYIGTKMVKKGA